MYADLQYLTVELPEDILKLKWYGDFERAQKLISMRLEKDIPEALRKRLELERVILERMPLSYIYTQEEALKRMQDVLNDVTEEELEQLRDEGAAEWIFVNGQVRYKDNFLENLLKTRPELPARLKDQADAEARKKGSKLLDDTIAAMKRQGGMAYHMHVKASLKVKPEMERDGAWIRVHLPIPVEYSQVKHFKLLGASMEDCIVAPADYPQRTVYMETNLQKDQEFWVEYEFENHTRYVELDENEVSDVQPTVYLEEQLPQIHFTPYLKELTGQVIGDETNPLKKARKIYDYITSHVMYSFVRQYVTITDLPGYMATGLKGDCGIYALLFITMCRIAGVPARWQSGLYATPQSIGCHDWAQFYVAPYGWLYADCSFGGAAYRAGAKERWDFYFGNLDPFRIPCASEFQHEFTPARKHLREDPYDNQVGEAEYEDKSLKSYIDYETKQEMIEIREIPLS